MGTKPAATAAAAPADDPPEDRSVRHGLAVCSHPFHPPPLPAPSIVESPKHYAIAAVGPLAGIQTRSTGASRAPPVDSVDLVSLVDNVADALMPGQGPAHRVVLGGGPTRPGWAIGDAAIICDKMRERGQTRPTELC